MPAVKVYTEKEARDYISRTMPTLMDVLRKAPSEVVYDRSSDDLVLENDPLFMQYDKFLMVDKFISLNFKGTEPQIGLHGMAGPRRRRSPRCCYIQLFDSEGNLLKVEEGYAFFRLSNYSPLIWYELAGDDKWFKEGTNLLREAYEKFNIQFWIDAYEGVPVAVSTAR
jgi:hypothetical protein